MAIKKRNPSGRLRPRKGIGKGKGMKGGSRQGRNTAGCKRGGPGYGRGGCRGKGKGRIK